MKHQIEKPVEPVMRFFTPARFIRFNSPDDDIADRANQEWETVLAEYREHLDQIWPRISKDAERLAQLNLHDAELLDPARAVDCKTHFRFEALGPPAMSFTPAIFPLKQDDQILTLIYLLSGDVRSHVPVRKWPFSKQRPHCLYDEVDIGLKQRGPFVHRLLISDGRVLEIPFLSVSIHSTPLSPLITAQLTRTSA